MMEGNEVVQQIAKDICKCVEAQSYCNDCYNFDKCKIAEKLFELNYRKQVVGEWIPVNFESLIPVEYDSDGNVVMHKYTRYQCSICGRTEREKEPYCNCGANMWRELIELKKKYPEENHGTI